MAKNLLPWLAPWLTEIFTFGPSQNSQLMTCLTTVLTWKWPGCRDVLAPPLVRNIRQTDGQTDDGRRSPLNAPPPPPYGAGHNKAIQTTSYILHKTQINRWCTLKSEKICEVNTFYGTLELCSLRIWLLVLTEYTNVTDCQTHRQTSDRHRDVHRMAAAAQRGNKSHTTMELFSMHPTVTRRRLTYSVCPI